MFPVYQAKDLIEAELLLQRLRDRGIPSGLQNDLLQGLLGELPFTVRPIVSSVSSTLRSFGVTN